MKGKNTIVQKSHLKEWGGEENEKYEKIERKKNREKAINQSRLTD